MGPMERKLQRFCIAMFIFIMIASAILLLALCSWISGSWDPSEWEWFIKAGYALLMIWWGKQVLEAMYDFYDNELPNVQEHDRGQGLEDMFR